MQRAEQEGRVQAPTTPEGGRHRQTTLGAFHPASQDTVDKADPAADLSLAAGVERITTVHSRVIAMKGGSYDALAERLYEIKTVAKAGGDNLRSILVTSTVAGEGKSLTVTNVSIAVSRMFNQRVLLLDGNLRSPSIHELLGLNRNQGLAEFLNGSSTAAEVVTKSDIPNLFVVTAGAAVGNPKELLNTRRMSDFLALVRQRFDWVFLDSSAVTPEPDAELLSSFVDGIVFITGKLTQPSSMREALRLLRGRKVLGIVQNSNTEPTQGLESVLRREESSS
jgi:capsular exopolysaccharide synthesis family protein